MLTALILICAASVSDCTRDNAADVLRVPGEFALPVPCFLRGQAYLAETSIGQDLRPGDRVKIICSRTNRGPR